MGQVQTSTSMDSIQNQKKIYSRLLMYHKKKTMSKKILENRKNTKQLFKIVNKVTNNNQQNPLSDRNPEELAEEFADYFLNKIKTSGKLLEDTEQYTPRLSNAPLFRRFAPLTEDEVKKELLNISTKACKLDSIPTGLLKQLTTEMFKCNHENRQYVPHTRCI